MFNESETRQDFCAQCSASSSSQGTDSTSMSPASIEKYLKGIDFPANKKNLINQAKPLEMKISMKRRGRNFPLFEKIKT